MLLYARSAALPVYSSGMEPPADTTAERLRQAMLRAGYAADTAGMRKLAERVSCSWQNIQGMLAGRSGKTRRAGVLYPLSRELGVRYEWLADGDGPMIEGESEIKRLVGDAFSRIPEHAITEALSHLLAVQAGEAKALIVTKDYIGEDRRKSDRKGDRRGRYGEIDRGAFRGAGDLEEIPKTDKAGGGDA
jgi:hypothetical protein